MLPAGFEPTDEWAKGNLGMSLGDFYSRNPGAKQAYERSKPIDPIEQARKLRDFTIESNRPAISSLQQSIPETSAKFDTERTRLQGEKEPLKQRYQSLLDEVKRRETVDVGAQERVTSREFGRRGIPLSSGLFDQTLQGELSPLRQFYTGQAKDVGFEQEAGLRGIEQLIASLTGQETDQLRTIKNTIGQLESGSPADAITGALSLLGIQNQASQSAAQQALAEREFALQERLANQPQQKDQYATLGEGSTLYDLINRTALFTAPKTYKGSGGGGALPDLNSIFD